MLIVTAKYKFKHSFCSHPAVFIKLVPFKMDSLLQSLQT